MRVGFTIERHSEILDDWQLVVQPVAVLRAEGINPVRLGERQPLFRTLAKRAIAEGTAWIHPRAVVRCLNIVERENEGMFFAPGGQLMGAGLSRRLTGAGCVLAAVATLGGELEQRIEKLRGQDLLFQMALDAFGTAALDEMTNALTRHVHALAGVRTLKATNPVYPGTKDWELSAAQTQIFSLVDASSIGVHLNPSFMMMPRKSVSMVYGLGAKVRVGKIPCAECEAASRCLHKPGSS
ncbi:MAG TPA: hypothetical protein VEI54_04445 [Candidatus Limnocylindrales bacterium]|nr:hypothetical protein [Candidatus Limnocylindrales bacterium]